MELIIQILHTTWHYTEEASIWLLVGFLFAGILKAFVPSEFLVNKIGGRNLKSIIVATLVGIPLPLCSCGVIPAGLGMYKQGASKSSVLSFFIATPVTTVTTILISLGMLGVRFTVVAVIAAFVISALTGIFGMFLLDHKNEDLKEASKKCHAHNLEECERCKPKFKEKIKTIFDYGFIEMVDDVGIYIIIGLLGAGIIGSIIPDTLIENYLDGSLLALCFMVLIGTPMYICSTASIPFVVALLAKGAHPAVALVFLIAGPATNISTILAIAKGMGKKTAAFYVLSIVILTVLVAYVVKVTGCL
ncbi:permease [bacterium]|nr:permease [bacterium]